MKPLHSICVSPDDADKVWISLGYLGDYYQACKPSKRILFTEDGGETWTDYSEGLPVYYVSDISFLEGSSECDPQLHLKESISERIEMKLGNCMELHYRKVSLRKWKLVIVEANYWWLLMDGLWECDLPSIKYDAPYVIRKDFELRTDAEDEALYITRDIELKKNAVLNISCVVHMAKGKKIMVKDTNQVRFTGNGKIDSNT